MKTYISFLRAERHSSFDVYAFYNVMPQEQSFRLHWIYSPYNESYVLDTSSYLHCEDEELASKILQTLPLLTEQDSGEHSWIAEGILSSFNGLDASEYTPSSMDGNIIDIVMARDGQYITVESYMKDDGDGSPSYTDMVYVKLNFHPDDVSEYRFKINNYQNLADVNHASDDTDIIYFKKAGENELALKVAEVAKQAILDFCKGEEDDPLLTQIRIASCDEMIKSYSVTTEDDLLDIMQVSREQLSGQMETVFIDFLDCHEVYTVVMADDTKGIVLKQHPLENERYFLTPKESFEELDRYWGLYKSLESIKEQANNK